MNVRRCYVSVAVLRGLVYAMGGYDGHHRQNTAERYDHRTNQWSLIAPMMMQRSDASATTLNGKSGNREERTSPRRLADPRLHRHFSHADARPLVPQIASTSPAASTARSA